MFLQREQFSERPTVYIHASVICPFSVIHHAMFRYQIYHFFHIVNILTVLGDEPSLLFCRDLHTVITSGQYH